MNPLSRGNVSRISPFLVYKNSGEEKNGAEKALVNHDVRSHVNHLHLRFFLLKVPEIRKPLKGF